MKVSDMLQAKMPVSEKEGAEAGVVSPDKEGKAPPLFRIKIVDRKE